MHGKGTGQDPMGLHFQEMFWMQCFPKWGCTAHSLNKQQLRIRRDRHTRTQAAKQSQRWPWPPGQPGRCSYSWCSGDS